MVMARGQRNGVKERHWRQHVAAWRRSGLSVREYCRTEGLAEPSFYAWRRVLTERAALAGSAADSEAVPPRRGSTAAAPFVPVRLVEDQQSSAAVEVVLRGGRVVRVPANFPAQTLRAVVAALEDLPC
jgi:transposase